MLFPDAFALVIPVIHVKCKSEFQSCGDGVEVSLARKSSFYFA
jgi:hypothetical protein